MRLYSLLKNIKCRVYGSQLIEIAGLYHKHNDVKQGGLFFCLSGKNFEGKNYVLDAINNGAVAVVVENEICGLKNVTQIIVKNARKTMSLIACNFYNNPADSLKIIGVTGTNGKTTTTFMLSGLLESVGKKSAVIGTSGVRFLGRKIETGMTTPDPILLQEIFSILVKNKIEYVCMEVSAHAIFLDKLDGIIFENIIFTNLTEDHLDFFENMENYYESKKKIFVNSHTKTALINIDDKFGERLKDSINIPCFTYSINNQSDFKALDLGLDNYKQKFLFNNKILISNFIGKFNIYNLMAAISCLKLLKLNFEDLQKSVFSLKAVPGRFNKIVIKNKLFVVDYAHTPDGLENVLKLCKEIVGNKKLICIFGCGGNRETQKRSKMGEIASKYADLVIISSDNPRFESREKIADDIASGVIGENYKVILNRSEAIQFAYKIAREGDLILVAGKGDENYIEENGIKIPYSDFEEIKKLESLDD